ncbi:hypothetical protein OQA88_11819 [Cercophora sp. LCS_1]
MISSPQRGPPGAGLKGFCNFLLLAYLLVLSTYTLYTLSGEDGHLFSFLTLFTWRYLRLVVNIIAFFCYTPAPIPRNAKYIPNKDVTVILPTIDPEGADFQECVRTCCENLPAAILIITAGDVLYAKTLAAVLPFQKEFGRTEFTISRTQIASKREQVAHAIPLIRTQLTVLLDDHVFWGPNFLRSLVAPFEDESVGLVGTNKSVRRVPNLPLWGRIWNLLGALYLIRHNFEVRATNTLDGGAFVVSARTCALRTVIIQSPAFVSGYTNERFLFGRLGPLNADDDNYVTRFVVRAGWNVKIQYTPDSCIETTVGVTAPVANKFLGQCRRWARTTWRSNSCSLFTDRSVWRCQPWSVYAVFLTSFTNFALFTDAGLVYLLWQSSWSSSFSIAILAVWILSTKMVKILPYFWQYPQDLYLFPVAVLYAYAHSFIKLWALVTFWDCQWSGRNLGAIAVKKQEEGQEEGQELVCIEVDRVVVRES